MDAKVYKTISHRIVTFIKDVRQHSYYILYFKPTFNVLGIPTLVSFTLILFVNTQVRKVQLLVLLIIFELVTNYNYNWPVLKKKVLDSKKQTSLKQMSRYSL